MKFAEFNKEVNPNDEICYCIKNSLGKTLSVTYQQAVSIIKTDVNARIYWEIPKGYIVLRTDESEVKNIIFKRHENVIVMQSVEGYFIFAKSTFERNTKNNISTTGIGIDTITWSDSKKTNVLLPFHNKLTTEQDIQSMSIIYGTTIGDIPIWLKPIKLATQPKKFSIQIPIIRPDPKHEILKQIINVKGYSVDDMKEIITIMSDYFLPTQSQLSTLEVDELYNNYANNITASFFDGTTFLHNKLGDYVIEACNIKQDSISKELYFYDSKDAIYKNDDRFINGYITRLCPSLKQYQKDETINYIKSYLYDDSIEFNKNQYSVVFKNGVLDLVTMNLEPMSPDHLESIKINANFNPNAYCSEVDEFFATATCKGKKADAAEIETLLYEAIGYSMLKTNALAKAFILLGIGRNGKSTYLDIIKQLLGRGNYTAISFNDLKGNFRASSLKGKLASLAGDISAKPIEETDMFKSIISAEEVMLEQKYKDAYEAILFSTMFFSCNKLPRTSDTSPGFYRRFVPIPFDANLDKITNVDGLKFHQKLMSQEAIDYVAYKACIAIHRVLDTTKEFTIPKSVKDLLFEYKLKNSSVLHWFYKGDPKGDKQKVESNNKAWSYQEYSNYCPKIGRTAVNIDNFEDELKTHLGIEFPEVSII